MEATYHITAIEAAKIGRKPLSLLIAKIEELTAVVNTLTEAKTIKIYSSTEVKALLNIGDKLLKKYRDEGLLAYTQVGDKFWYSEADIQKFLSDNYFPAFALAG